MDSDITVAPADVSVFINGKNKTEDYFLGLFNSLPATVIVQSPIHDPERKSYLKRCLRSLYKSLPNTPIMVSETKESNLSLWTNVLMDLVGTRLAVLVSDDIILESFNEDVLETVGTYDIFGIVNTNYDGSRYYDLCWCRWDRYVSALVPYDTDVTKTHRLGTYYIKGNFLGFSTKLWRMVGGFDESIEKYGNEVEFQDRCVSVGANLRFLREFSLRLQYFHPRPLQMF